MQDIQTTLPIGSVVRDRYIVEDLLGKGGFGAVYLVSDQRVKGNLFALKEVIDPNKQERDRFTFECNVLRRLDYASLPRVYHAFEDDKNNRAYMLMDYIEGENLEVLRLQQPSKRFPLLQVMAMMAPVVDAVAYLHKQNPPIIHRDIKPANIIAPPEGASSMLVDFGIAKEYDQDSTTTAVRRCSPGYGAPEQYARGTNPRTDIYGLGATFYALLTGSVPADALHRMTHQGSKHTDPLESVTQLAPDVPLAVGAVIQRAMAIDSKERYGTVDEFWQALKSAAQWKPSPVPMTPLPVAVRQIPSAAVGTITAPTGSLKRLSTRRRASRRSLWLMLLALLALIALATGLVFGLGLWPFTSHTAHPASTATGRAAGSPSTTHTPGSTSTSGTTKTPGSTSTTSATATPTTGSAIYPVLAPGYEGTIHNTPYNVNSDMSLTSIHQSGSSINGDLTLAGTDLLGNGHFSGNVSTDKKIQFLVPGYKGLAPLFFTGTIQSNGSMQGNYCSVDTGTHCNNNAGGYGTWNVNPVLPGSISPSAAISTTLTPTDLGSGSGDGKDKDKNKDKHKKK